MCRKGVKGRDHAEDGVRLLRQGKKQIINRRRKESQSAIGMSDSINDIYLMAVISQYMKYAGK
jgi:phosphoserine phosphatase